MPTSWSKWWPALRAAFVVAVLAAVGWRFASDLRHPGLWERSFRPGWLAVAAVLYLLGLGCCPAFWFYLLRVLGQTPTVAGILRGYYIGLLGKYLPGKAWALFMRAALVRGPGVRLSVAVYTSFYEVLTTMSAGVLLAAGIFLALLPPTPPGAGRPLLRYLLGRGAASPEPPSRDGLVALAAGLLLAVGLPLIPGIFNRVVRGIAAFRRATSEGTPLPHVPARALPVGLAVAAVGWLLLGASLWAVIQSVLDRPEPWDVRLSLRYTGIVGIAYVAGFIILLVPSGLGVREFLLTVLLVPELARFVEPEEAARPVAVLSVLILRLVWTGAEVLMAAAVYWLPDAGNGKRGGEARDPAS